MDLAKIWLIFSLLLLVGCSWRDFSSVISGQSSQAAVVLKGTGAAFPSPVYRAWAYPFAKSADRQTEASYQGIGSNAGMKLLKEGTIDFAGSDSPLQAAELEQEGLAQLPRLAAR